MGFMGKKRISMTGECRWMGGKWWLVSIVKKAVGE